MKTKLLIISLIALLVAIPQSNAQNAKPTPPKKATTAAAPAAKAPAAAPAAKKATPASGVETGASSEGSSEELADGTEVEVTITLRKIFMQGGWIMYVIAGLSFVSIALAIFYALTMRAGMLFPRRFILEARDIAENGDLEGLQDLCAENSSPAARIISASLDQIVPGQAMDYNRLRDAMEDEGGRQAGIQWQRLQYLMDVAVISPMVGLLGTVWGMMVSFAGIESGADFAKKAETMASGIAQAMYTTFGGLIVGIFAMALYDLMRGHLNKLTSSMESACGSVLRSLASSQPMSGRHDYGTSHSIGGVGGVGAAASSGRK